MGKFYARSRIHPGADRPYGRLVCVAKSSTVDLPRLPTIVGRPKNKWRHGHWLLRLLQKPC